MNYFRLTDIIQSALHTAVLHILFQAVTTTDLSVHGRYKIRHDQHEKSRIQTKADIPLCLVKDDTRVQYVSAIALKLSKQWEMPAAHIADTLCNTTAFLINPSATISDAGTQDTNAFLHRTAHLSAKLLPHIALEPSSLGWLSIRVSHIGVAIWLTHLFETLAFPLDVQFRRPEVEHTRFSSIHNKLRDCTELFDIQHAIARCCSLLDLVTITELDKSRYSASDQSSSTSGQNLRLIKCSEAIATYGMEQASLSEHLLLHALVQTFDEVSNLPMPSIESGRRYMRLAHQLSRAFQQFHAQVPLGDPTAKGDLNLMQFRLWLIGLCALVLRSLLIEGLGVEPCAAF